MKVVELKKLNNFHVGNFPSCYGKSKVILEILICPNSKLEFPQFGIWNSNCFVKFIFFHLESALDTKTCFVACEILNNFHFNRFWTLVQSLGEFCKKQKGGDRDGYTDPMGITSSVQCGRRAGRRRLRTCRHAPSHAAARLLTVVVKWTSRWHPHPLLPVVNTPLRPCSSLLAQRRRPCCACEIRLTRSLSKLPEHTSGSAKTLATDCAPSRKLWPLVALNRSILLQSRPKRCRGHLTAASSSPSFSTVALCFVEVAVSHWCLYAIRFMLYSLVAAGAGTAEVAVRRARGRGG